MQKTSCSETIYINTSLLDYSGKDVDEKLQKILLKNYNRKGIKTPCSL